MKNLSNTIARAVLTLAVAGVGIGLSAGDAGAAAIVFSVEEGVVPGASNTDPTGTEIDATDNIEGQYGELLTLTPSVGPCAPGALACGTFDADIFVDFNDYNLGSTPLPSQLGVAVVGGETGVNCVQPACGGTELYGMYALVEAEGTYSVFNISGTLFYSFTPTSSTAEIYLDPDRDTLKSATGPTATDTAGVNEDVLIMTASTLDPLSTGGVQASGTTVQGGFFTLIYTDPTLLNLGPQYWPTLNSLTLEATATGQVHTPTSTLNPAGQSSISGSVNLSFNQAPEPASMALLGLGFLGAAFAARRRRTS